MATDLERFDTLFSRVVANDNPSNIPDLTIETRLIPIDHPLITQNGNMVSARGIALMFTTVDRTYFERVYLSSEDDSLRTDSFVREGSVEIGYVSSHNPDSLVGTLLTLAELELPS